MTRYLTMDPGTELPLPARGGWLSAVHVFERDAIDAVNAALAARRPLLVRGEPGTGKSQLARAAAEQLGRVFLPKVIDAHTEARDLCYSFDAVARLAEAQLLGAARTDPKEMRAALHESNFVTPGPLWWAFHWESASRQALNANAQAPDQPRGWTAADGCVVLLDEIDKADSAVPNGLLEALGSGAFSVPGRDRPVCAQGQTLPLVIVTTNEERALPDAFLRRCLVLPLALPAVPKSGEATELLDWLVARGSAHFPLTRYPSCSSDVLVRAAELLVEDRRAVTARGLTPPGQAEYLDLLRAVLELSDQLKQPANEILARVAGYALRKHPAEAGL